MSREIQIEEMALTEVDILANDLNQHCADLAENYCGGTNCLACLANALYNKGYRKQEWISVEERLPQIDKNGKGRYGGERSVRVLCVCKQRGGKTFVKEGYYEPCANGSVFWRIPGSIDSVTHWMPLPEPPKKGGAE